MPLRGQRTAHPAAVARTVRPAETSRIGIRRIVVERRGGERTWHIDPGDFACSLMAAQLADEWALYAETTGIRDPGKQATAVRRFATFTDAWAAQRGVDARLVRLDGGLVDLTEVLFDWEHALRAQFPPPSKAPYSAVGWILALIAQRAARDAQVPETLRARAAAPALFDKQPCTVLDEFSQAERLALRDAARRDVRALEERLARGQELLAAGRDPRITGWCAVENLVWAAGAGILSVEAVRPHLPRKVGRWPAPLRELALSVGVGGPGPGCSIPSLILAAASLLFPREIDLQPLRVLLLLGMGDCTPEELLDLQIPDVEFTDGGVRIRQTKARVDRIRGVLHTGAKPGPGPREESGAGQWDVPGLLRRLVAVTEPARARSEGTWLFTAVEFQGTGCRRIAPAMARFTRQGRRLTHWIARHDGSDGHPMLQVSEPHDARRLRKTAKTARVVALGGAPADLAADDHHIEVSALTTPTARPRTYWPPARSPAHRRRCSGRSPARC
ncbi:hypothetical protein ABT010_40590 [Streptomyces sp. NPDC002668]|uniref:hypothetical protein n=1 Tax=Streptomyces sp. NPDC002668 TaxID=3154422 RepID=UPI00331FF03D